MKKRVVASLVAACTSAVTLFAADAARAFTFKLSGTLADGGTFSSTFDYVDPRLSDPSAPIQTTDFGPSTSLVVLNSLGIPRIELGSGRLAATVFGGEDNFTLSFSNADYRSSIVFDDDGLIDGGETFFDTFNASSLRENSSGRRVFVTSATLERHGATDVPEPATLIGTLAALGIGVGLKRRTDMSMDA